MKPSTSFVLSMPPLRSAAGAAAVAAGLLAAWTPGASAEVRLPHVFGDHMVLQRDRVIPVWGWADPGEEVAVRIDDGEPVAATAGDGGRWEVRLPALPAGGPHTVTVRGGNEIVLSDVLVGDVWVCSGQSNMQWTVRQAGEPEAEIAAASHPRLRHFAMPRVPEPLPVDDREVAWQVCSPETAGNFTAAGYFFGRELLEVLDVPIGLLNASWGGTRIEPWTTPEGFAAVPSLESIHREVVLADPRSDTHRAALESFLGEVRQWMGGAVEALGDQTFAPPMPAFPDGLKPLSSRPSPQQQPTTLYNGMVHPLVPFAIRGAIWYQGESNHNEGMLYADKKRALVDGWREAWGQGDFPFYWVQIAPFQYGEEDPGILPAFWEAQTAALDIPKTGMVVIHDVGNLRDIHPKNKQAVGRRLALVALANEYGREGLVWSGPMFREMRIEDGRIRVAFDHVGGGLATRDGRAPDWFEVLGRGTGWKKAEAVIDGETVVVSSPEVEAPVSVRLGWHKLAEPNLMNSAGLPAAPFRAGEILDPDVLHEAVPDAGTMRLVHDLDLGTLGDGPIEYAVDRSRDPGGAFGRIGYLLELQKPGGPLEWAYAEMGAFTDDAGKIGLPHVSTGAHFHQAVEHLTVRSNHGGLKTGDGMEGGWIEAWPHNYAPANAAGVPGASGDLYDFGDSPNEPRAGYGCFQIHHAGAGQTILAVNHWSAGAGADLGIGNSEGRTRDWTFVGNAGSYTHKRLRVFVR